MNRRKWWLELLVAICVWSPWLAFSKEVQPRDPMPYDSFRVPIASDTCFLVHYNFFDAGDPVIGDLGYFRENTIRFQIQIPRYFGNKQLLLKNGALPKKVTLRMAALVGLVRAVSGKEHEVFVNNHSVGFFRGTYDAWIHPHFEVPISYINLPSSPGETAVNEITIKIGVGRLKNERWNTRVNWAALEIPAPPPVVISHGINDSAEGMRDLKEAVEALGLPVHTFSYSDQGFNSIEMGAHELARAIYDAQRKFRVDKCTILCHSMGGIKARHYTTEIDRRAASVDRVIQIATPNGGARLADLLLPFPFARGKGPAVEQLTVDKMDIYNFNHSHLNPKVKYVGLAGRVPDTYPPGDTVVSVESAHTMIPLGSRYTIQDSQATHSGLVSKWYWVNFSSSEFPGPHFGIVGNVISKILRKELLAIKGASHNNARALKTLRQGTTSKLQETAPSCFVVSGTIPMGNNSFAFPFHLFGNGGSAQVSFVAEENIQITNIRSPSGKEYTSVDDDIEVSQFAGIMTIHLTSAEAGEWTVTATRESGEGELPYALAIQEINSEIVIDGKFQRNTGKVESSFTLDVRPTKDGAALTEVLGLADIILPDGTEQSVTLRNLGGGLYQVTFNAIQSGIHLVTTRFCIEGRNYIRTFSCTAYDSVAKFETLASDGPADNDGDGFYDRLSISGMITGVGTGVSYRVSALLSDLDGENVTWAEASITNGATAFRLDFDGASIYAHGRSPEYVVSYYRLFEKTDAYEVEIDTRDGEVVFEGMDWSWQDFAHSLVAISETGTDVAVATNVASSVKTLLVDLNVEYDASVAGTYDCRVSLKTSNGTVIGTFEGTVELPPPEGSGTVCLHLEFDGSDIAASMMDGPYYVTDLLLWNDSCDFSATGSYETQAWEARDFLGGNYVDPDTGLTWKYGIFDNEATVGGVNPACGTLDIPSELGGCAVTAISAGAFAKSDELTSVTIPAGVTDIGADAFSDCTGLFAVDIPNGVTNIGRFAFNGCTNLASLTIPGSVESIGSSAFAECSNLLETASIPGVLLVDGWVVGCDNPCVVDLDLTGVRGIADEVFAECRELTSVTVSDSLTKIGYGAFAGCTSLTLTLTGAASHNYPPFFQGCNQLTHLSLGAGTTRVPSSCFTELDSLQSVDLPNSVTNIGEYAFANCGELTSVFMPQRLTSIGRYAFDNCNALQEVRVPDIAAWCKIVFANAYANPLCHGAKLYLEDELLSQLIIPNRVTNITSFAFYGISNLTSVTIGSGVKNIGMSAFAHCDNLELATIGDSVKSIENYAFSYCNSLKVTVIGNGVTNVGSGVFASSSSSSASTLYVPASWEGTSMLANANVPSRCKVVYGTIGFETVDGINWSFVSNDEATMVLGGNCTGDAAIPSQLGGYAVTSLGDYAFYKHDGVTSIVMSDSITNVGKYVFYNCRGLSSVTISDSVTTIGSCAFYGCSSLATLTIPDSVTSVGGGAFSQCTGLETLYVPQAWKGTSMLASADVPSGCQIIYGTGESDPDEPAEVEWLFEIVDGAVTILGANPAEGSLAIPSELYGYPVTSIGDYAFSNSNGLESVTIPEGVTNLGNNAFAYCENLQEVTLPASMTSIGAYALYFCRSLPDVTIPDSVTSMGECAFGNCNSIKTVTIGSGVTNLVQTFHNCSELSAVTIGPNVVDIGRLAFCNCTNLPVVAIPNGVTNIGSSAFGNCAGLTNVIIGDNVRAIGNGAFQNCSGLTSVMIPFSVSKLDDNAFAGCHGLRMVTIPDGVTHIGSYTFSRCSGITNIIIGGHVRNIGSSAFFSCSGLLSVTIPACVTNIGNSAFRGCSNLEGILVESGNLSYESEEGVLYVKDKRVLVAFPGGKTGGYMMPDAVNSIGNYAFGDCSQLDSITVSSSVTNIGYGAFSGCRGLTSMIIPDNVSSIGGYAFYGCSNMATLYVPASWEGTTKLANAQVPANCMVVYGLPEEQVTSTPVPVPFAWLDECAAEILAANGNDYEAAANAIAANGQPVWLCYLTGVNTEESDAKFHANIRLVDGKLEVVWTPDLNEDGTKTERVYRVYGKKSMSDGEEWRDVTDVEDLDADGWRFFRVKVGMPE